MKSLVFCTLYAVLVFQVCSSADNDTKSTSGGDSDPKSSGSSSDESDKYDDGTLIEDEFAIINECTMIPSTMNELIADYINARPQNGDAVLAKATRKAQTLADQIATMRTRVHQHVQLFGDVDPDAQILQQKILATLDVVESSAARLLLGVRNAAENGDDEDGVYARIRYVENDVEPTIAALERICIAETQDILKNVFEL